MEQVEELTLTFPADRKYLALVGSLMHEIQRYLPKLPDAIGYNIELAIDEAVANIISHAYHDAPGGRISLSIELAEDSVTVRIRDWGESYDPEKVREPDFGHPEERGYGLYLIRKLMDHVSYQADPIAGNCATLIKRF